MEPWHREIEQLHEFFEAYFLGTVEVTNVDRFESALGADFSIVGPDGNESDRASTVAALTAGHDHTSTLKITISDARLLVETNDAIVVRYVENHELAERSNHRLSTVVFDKDLDGPNGLRWRSVHETWLPDAEHQPDS